MKRKLLFVLIGLFIFILGPKVYALDPSIEVEYVKNDTETVELDSERFGGLVYYISNPQGVEVKLKGYNLADDTDYQIVMESIENDNRMSNTSYVTKEQLQEGVVVNPSLSVKIYVRPYGANENMLIGGKNILYIFMTNPDSYDDLFDYYMEIANVETYDENRIDTISVDLYDTGYSIFGNNAIGEKLSSEDVTVRSECYSNRDCKIELSKDSLMIRKEVKISFTKELDSAIKAKVDKYIADVNNYDAEYYFSMGLEPNFTYYKMFVIEDLENINYLYNYAEDDIFELLFHSKDYILRYSGVFNNLIGNSNFNHKLQLLAGDMGPFGMSGVGEIAFLYNDEMVGVTSGAAASHNKIYISDDTPNTREAFIKAAEDRIKEYLQTDDVSISYAGQIMDDYDYLPSSWHFSIDQTLGEYYTLQIGEENFEGLYFIIIKDSSRMQEKPTVTTVDLDTDVIIETDSPEVPLESTIQVLLFGANSGEYKNLMKKLEKTDGIVVDLKIFSRALNGYISKLENGEFKVYVPLKDNKFTNKEIVAVYVKEDGTIEEYPATIEDGYAVFRTNHFSTYAIVEASEALVDEEVVAASDDVTDIDDTEEIENPKTADSIYLNIAIIFASISFLYLILTVKKGIKIINIRE